MVIERHDFQPRDYVGGDVLLDFVNTVTGRNMHPRDWLADCDAFVHWACGTGLAEILDHASYAKRPALPEDGDVLKAAKALREALYVLLTARIEARAAPAAALETLQQAWHCAVRAGRLGQRAGGQIGVCSSRAADDPARLVDALALHAVQFLGAEPGDRLRHCAGPNCGWLFLDVSKAGRRRWCDMATCGNTAKARRHYRRKTGETGLSF